MMDTDLPHSVASGRAFVDTNVLAHIVSDTHAGQSIIKILRDANFEIVTFAKCIYELYSIARGTTKDGPEKKNHPLKRMIPPEINDIAQRLFKKSPDIDAIGNSYYWYNLSEEWQGWDYSVSTEEKIEELVQESWRDDAHTLLEKHGEFAKWKQGMLLVFNQIDSAIEKQRILVCEYSQVFSSDWYKRYGFSYEQELAKNSLLPNEDFEIVMAALFLQAKVFVTEDDRDLIWRGGLSLGLNMPKLVFCRPERLADAIKDNFTFKFYSKRKSG